MLEDLTPRQAHIYEFIVEYTDRHGYSPSVRDIVDHFGINSLNGVVCNLKALKKKGVIKRSRHDGETEYDRISDENSAMRAALEAISKRHVFEPGYATPLDVVRAMEKLAADTLAKLS